MSRSLIAATLVVVSLATVSLIGLVAPASAQAPQRCAEGRTASGQCVRADLAQEMRTTGIVQSQPKFSITNAPVLPGQDGEYAPIRDGREIRNLHSGPPINSVNGGSVDVPFFTAPFIITVPTGPRS